MTIRHDKQTARQRGVSLVEILIVLSIVAMAAGVIIINAPPGRSDLRDTADEFAARLEFAGQNAITSGTLIGMALGEEGYSFHRYGRGGGWDLLEERGVAAEKFSADYAVDLEIAEAAKKNRREDARKETEKVIRPEILFTPTGETTPFAIVFRNRRESIRVSLDNAGHVDIDRDADR